MATNILNAMPDPEVSASLSMSWIVSGIFSIESSNHMMGNRNGSVAGSPDKTEELSIRKFIWGDQYSRPFLLQLIGSRFNSLDLDLIYLALNKFELSSMHH